MSEVKAMKVLVPIKRVIDHQVRVRVKSDGSGVDTVGVKMSINPFDEVAVEQAVRWKAQGLVSEVLVVAMGATVTQDVLRTALAMGADAAVLIETPVSPSPLDEGRLLAELARREGVGLVLCGKQAIDDDLGSLAPTLAALLDWPQAMSVNAATFTAEGLEVVCDGDQGSERLALSLPAVLGVDLRLCDPRMISLPAMMKARKATVRTLAATDLGVALSSQCEVVCWAEPPPRAPGRKVADTATLLGYLQTLTSHKEHTA
jgi:electron transfer flavoprotein beta subunit